jgi:hypothetical protein
MTQSGDTPPAAPVPAPDGARPKPKGRPSGFLGFVMVTTMVLVAIALVVIWHKVRDEQAWNVPVQNVGEPPRPDGTVQTVQALEARVAAMESRLARLEQAPPPAMAPAPEAVGETPADLNAEVAALTSSLGELQSRLRQTEATADQGRDAALSSLGAVVAFTGLRLAAATGEGFAHEWEALRRFSGASPALQEAVDALEPVTAGGAPALPVLRETFAALAPAAAAEARKADAKDWKERLQAALQGLVSIRPLHPVAGADDPYGAIEDDLRHYRLIGALGKEGNLPEAARAVLKDWRRQAEARLLLESLLANVADRIVPQEP